MAGVAFIYCNSFFIIIFGNNNLSKANTLKMGKINKLKNVIQEDISKINQAIKEGDRIDLSFLFKYIDRDEDMLYLDFDLFIDIINTFCYEIDYKDYDGIKGFVPEDRLQLFKEIFLEKIDLKDSIYIDWIRGGNVINSEELLYNRLFYSLFINNFTSTTSLEEKLLELHDQWKTAIKDNEMPVKFEVALPNVYNDGEIPIMINNDFKITRLYSYNIYSGRVKYGSHSAHSLSHEGLFLIFNTELSFNHNLLGKSQGINLDKDELKKEYRLKFNAINEIIFSLNIIGIDFIYKHYELILPWWMGDEEKKYDIPNRNLGKVNITNQQINDFFKTYKKVSKHHFLSDTELEIILYRYSKLNRRKLVDDVILDEFMILESIFTRGGDTEVGFRLALNLAFFLAKDIAELDSIYEFINKIYRIRSKIAHGENWTNYLRKRGIPKILGFDSSNVEKKEIAKKIAKKLKPLINRSINKILDLKIEQKTSNDDYQIIEKFERLYFIENSEIIKNK